MRAVQVSAGAAAPGKQHLQQHAPLKHTATTTTTTTTTATLTHTCTHPFHTTRTIR